MTNAKARSCTTCSFYEITGTVRDKDRINIDEAVCRRRIHAAMDLQGRVHSFFAPTRPDSWCGEWKA